MQEKDFNIYIASEKELLDYIDTENYFNEKELLYLMDSGYEKETTYGENRRWSRSAYTILEIGGRFFGFDWEQGLTENQEDYFPSGSLEELEEFEEVKIVKGWRVKK